MRPSGMAALSAFIFSGSASVLALIGVHLALVLYQKHTQFPGPGRTEKNVVGVRILPVFAVKSGAFFAIVTTLFPLGISPELSRLRDVAPGVLWVAALLAHKGWRLLMLVGVLPAFLTLFIRLYVPESSRWVHERDRGATDSWAGRDLLGVGVWAAGAVAMIYLWAAELGPALRLTGSALALVVVTVGYLYPVTRYLQRSEEAGLAGGWWPVVRRMLLGACLSGIPLIVAGALIAGHPGLVVPAAAVVAVATRVVTTVSVLMDGLVLLGRHALKLGVAGDLATDRRTIAQHNREHVIGEGLHGSGVVGRARCHRGPHQIAAEALDPRVPNPRMMSPMVLAGHGAR